MVHDKGRKPPVEVQPAKPVPPDSFAETLTWVEGQIKGRIAICVDDLLQAGAKPSNIDFLKALEKVWEMSTPEHVAPLDRYEKLKFIGVMISRQTVTMGRVSRRNLLCWPGSIHAGSAWKIQCINDLQE